ncbi:5-oxoprolinase subunit B family protein [Paracoccus salsus]|uniref:5-oxoprolinase subunit B family protein n=1 Tax=Paracoccus salsus TaxID=2911061 RepID=UPI001F1956D0|nr:carboxyltransferase domain-containing protein [Paracoccus salsus]MCF3973367.1 allophanate hydrolase subunit 1 [Paracoccus salsus]
MTGEPTLAPEILPAGPDGVLLRFGLKPQPLAMAAAQVLAGELDSDLPHGVVEIAPALVSVLLRFDPAATSRAVLARDVLARAERIAGSRPAPPAPLRRWTIPASFGGDDGPQLAEVAELLGVSQDAATRQLCTADLRVLTIGFAPGQPYIGLLPPAWNLPRMPDLNPNVPAGAVVVAVRQIVMFGAESATGWRQIARAAFRTFRPERDEPMPLRAGDAIRYTPASAAEIATLAREADGMGGATVEMLR